MSIWNYFANTNNPLRYRCKICNKTFAKSGGASKLTRHLLTHPKIKVKKKPSKQKQTQRRVSKCFEAASITNEEDLSLEELSLVDLTEDVRQNVPQVYIRICR